MYLQGVFSLLVHGLVTRVQSVGRACWRRVGLLDRRPALSAGATDAHDGGGVLVGAVAELLVDVLKEELVRLLAAGTEHVCVVPEKKRIKIAWN